MNINKIVIAIIVVVVVALGGYFLFKGPSAPSLNLTTQAPSQETSPAPSVPTTEAPSSEEYVVTYTDTGYSPSLMKIEAGETVIFKNESSKSMWPASAFHPTHTVYSGTSLSEHCPDTAGTAFDACKGFLPGQSWSFKFTKVGTWKYHDHLNPGATGTIVVE